MIKLQIPNVLLTKHYHRETSDFPIGKCIILPNQYQTNPLVCETLEQSKQNIQHLMTDFEFYLFVHDLKLTNYQTNHLTVNDLNYSHLKQIAEDTVSTV